MGQQEFTGGVYDRSLPGGRAVAVVSLGVVAVEARLDDGRTLAVPYSGMELELGGTGDGIVSCHSQDRSTSIFTPDKSFLLALIHNGVDQELAIRAEQLQQRGFRRQWTRRGLIAVALVAVLALVWFTPTWFRWGVARAVDNLPQSVDEKLGAVAMGGTALVEFHDPVVDTAMQSILARLREHVPAKYATWNFRVMVVTDDSINAFALPGGQMVFHSGLLRRAGSADEVAGVMAHEMAHVLERHGLRRVAQSVGVVAAVGLLFGDTGVLAAAAAEYLTLATINSYSRSDESEADHISVTIIHRAGLDPAALGRMFERMKQEGDALPDLLHWVSTHPSHDQRIDAIHRQIQGLAPVDPRPLAIDWSAVQAALPK